MAYLNSLPPPSEEQVGHSRPADRLDAEAVYGRLPPRRVRIRARAKVRLLDPAVGRRGELPEQMRPADLVTRAKAALDRMVAAEAEQKAAQAFGAANDPGRAAPVATADRRRPQ